MKIQNSALVVASLVATLLIDLASAEQRGLFISGDGAHTVVECANPITTQLTDTLSLTDEDGKVIAESPLALAPNGATSHEFKDSTIPKLGVLSVKNDSVICHSIVYTESESGLVTSAEIPFQTPHEMDDTLVDAVDGSDLVVLRFGSAPAPLFVYDRELTFSKSGVAVTKLEPGKAATIKTKSNKFAAVRLFRNENGQLISSAAVKKVSCPISPIQMGWGANLIYRLTLASSTNSNITLALKDNSGALLRSTEISIKKGEQTTVEFNSDNLPQSVFGMSISCSEDKSQLISGSLAATRKYETGSSLREVRTFLNPVKAEKLALLFDTDREAGNTLMLYDTTGREQKCSLDVFDNLGSPISSFGLKVIPTCVTVLTISNQIGPGVLGLGVLEFQSPWTGNAEVLRRIPISKNRYSYVRVPATVIANGKSTKLKDMAVPAVQASATAQKALALELAGDLQAALAQWKEALLEYPRFMCALEHLTQLTFRLNLFDESTAYAKTALSYDPKNIFAHEYLGLIAASKSDFTNAVEFLRFPNREDPTNPWHAANLASVLIQISKFDEATKVLDTALFVQNDPTLLSQKAGLITKQYGLESSKRFWETAREAILAKPSSTAWSEDTKKQQLIEADLNLGINDEARTLLKELVAKEPTSIFGLLSLGSLSRTEHNDSDAISYYREALKLRPDDAATHIALGLIFDDQKSPGEAEVEYQAAIRINPKNAWGYNNLGVIRENEGKIDEAIELYTKAAGLAPNERLIQNNLRNIVEKYRQIH